MKRYHIVFLLKWVLIISAWVNVNQSALAGNIETCELFPSDNVWNTPIDKLPVHPYSNEWVANIGRGATIHPDFGSKWDGNDIGIPYNIVKATHIPKHSITFLYNSESDIGPYPIGINPNIESGSDHHLIILDIDTCKLYELFDASYQNDWKASSGAIWDLKSNAMRPVGWTSADAAGLPILPGLIRYDEVASGVINHAIRFVVEKTDSYIWPGSHLTKGKPNQLNQFQPPLGARFRLKSSFDISGFDPNMQVILKAMKIYGLILADNGGNWFISGVPDERWDNDALAAVFKRLKGNEFDVVDESCLMVDSESAQADMTRCQGNANQSVITPNSKKNVDSQCSVFLSKNSISISKMGGFNSIVVETGSSEHEHCDTSIKANVNWILIDDKALKTTKRVMFFVAKNNTGVKRTAVINIADKAFNVLQTK
ncbi:MAG: hypothetical protein WCG16_05370 [Methylococcales bacterium]